MLAWANPVCGSVWLCVWLWISFGEFVVSGSDGIYRGRSKNAPDGVASSESNPLRNWAVLLLGLGQLLLGSERLVALEREKDFISIHVWSVASSAGPSQPSHHKKTGTDGPAAFPDGRDEGRGVHTGILIDVA